ncbi:MAG: tRNA 2-thiocytidine biosynthesis protein TtcA [Treponema sp.]|nr:tRNA 2-thiocytidine biosynthesis protein TtcA [Treponema sp.]
MKRTQLGSKQHPKLSSLIDKAVFDYNMIEDGDAILIGASGGKDSTALVEYFANRARRPRCNFSFKAVHIQSDFAPPFSPKIISLFDSWHVPFAIIDVDVRARIKQHHKMNCWWCSMQRRTELVQYAIAHKFNKIALGHHLDDILETLLMNMLNKSELSTMPPRFAYNKYPVTIVRPLCYASVEALVRHAHENGWSSCTCTCNYQDNSGRKEARAALQAITCGNEAKKMHLFESLKNIQNAYLP